MLKVLVVCRGS